MKALFLGKGFASPTFVVFFHEILGKDDLVGLVTAPWNLMIDNPKYSSVRGLKSSKRTPQPQIEQTHGDSKHPMEILKRNMLQCKVHKRRRCFFMAL